MGFTFAPRKGTSFTFGIPCGLCYPRCQLPNTPPPCVDLEPWLSLLQPKLPGPDPEPLGTTSPPPTPSPVEANDSFQRQFVANAALVALFLTWNVVGGLPVEERNLLSGANKFSPVLVDAAVPACTFPRPSVVVKCNQLSSEMRNVRACCYHANALFCNARQLSTDLESLEISCRQENSRPVTMSHTSVLVVTVFSAVACLLLHACSFVSHGLCLSCMVIASAAILLLC